MGILHASYCWCGPFSVEREKKKKKKVKKKKKRKKKKAIQLFPTEEVTTEAALR